MKKLSVYKRLALFPLLFIYLEVVVHAFMGMSFKYLPIYLLFSIAYGAIVTAIIGIFDQSKYVTITRIVVLIISVLYGTEYFAKTILSTFYPFSILGTAANNHLGEFEGTIRQALISKYYVIILFLVPFLLTLIFMQSPKQAKKRKARKGRSASRASGQDEAQPQTRTQRKSKKRLKKSAVIIISLMLAIVSYLLGLFIVFVIPSKSDLTPKMLYKSDTNFDDQVEQLGLMNMMRLDIKHMIWPVEGEEFTGTEQTPKIEPEAKYNVMDFDIDKMMEAAAGNSNLTWCTKYVQSAAATKENDYTAKIKGYNVVFITVEGMSGYGISQEYTPNLYKMSHECFIFNNFYTALHYTSTSNGECQNLLGLYPKGGNPITMKRTGELKTNCYFSLAPQLNRLGYKSLGYHNNQYNLYGREDSHKNLGYEYYGGHMPEGKFLVDGKSWPQKDSYMIDQTTSMYANPEQPFNIYYITISGHTPYGWNYANQEYKEALADAPYTEKTKGYIATLMEFDKAVDHLVTQLGDAGVLDKTLIVIVPDHIPYGSVEILEELSGKHFGTSEDLSAINESSIDFDVYKSTLIMWNSRMAEDRPKVIDKVCCQVDILPTISNLLGLEYDSRMLAGQDILSDSEGLVVFSSKSFKTDLGFYNRFTQEFTPNEKCTLSGDALDEYVQNKKSIANNKLELTSHLIESNFYDFAIKYLGSSN